MIGSTAQSPGAGGTPRSAPPGAEVLQVLWRRRLTVVTVTIVGGILAFGLSHLQTEQYEATSQLILADPASSSVFDDSGLFIDSTRHVRTQAELATSGPVLAYASRLLDRRLSADALEDVVSVRASRDLDLVTIHARDTTPEGAVEIADSIGEAYQSVVSEAVQAKASAAVAELDQARAVLQARISELEGAIEADPDNAVLRAERDAAVAEAVGLDGRARQIAVDAALYGSGVQLFEPASPPDGPARPLPLRDALAGAVIAFAAVAGLVWWRSQRSATAEHRHDPAPILRAPLLGAVPDLGSMKVSSHAPSLTDPDSPAAEAYNFVAASLLHALGDRPEAVILVTSPGEGDGKTVTALNTAVSIARGGREVVVVDGDERVRGLTRWFGLPHAAGLTDLARGRRFEECSSLLVGWAGAAFSFIPSGSPVDNTAGFFRSAEFGNSLVALRGRDRVVIVDSPPVLVVSDTLAMAPHADGVVLVIEQGTELRAIEEAGDRIASAGTPILGYVFNRADHRSAGHYGYRYGEYHVNPQPSPNGHSNGRLVATSNRR